MARAGTARLVAVQVALAVREVDGSISCLKYDKIKPDANTHPVRRRFIEKKQ